MLEQSLSELGEFILQADQDSTDKPGCRVSAVQLNILKITTCLKLTELKISFILEKEVIRIFLIIIVTIYSTLS